jgi:hypothetical protein
LIRILSSLVPPRPPPSPPVLTILCCIAALAAVWVCLAVDQLARGLAGALLGVPMGPVTVGGNRYLLMVFHGPLTGLSPWGFAFVVLAGTVSVIGLAFLLAAATAAMRSPGWLRGFALTWVVVALLWVPAALVAGSMRRGAGPAAELYQRLGPPQAGRWTTAVLALVILVLVAGTVSARAVAVGRAWIRADGLGFRRRLVRVTAGWPAVIALVALGVGAQWAKSPWLAAFPAAVMAALHWRTR